MQKLRAAIDAIPIIRAALEARGLSAQQVLTAQTNVNGRLMLITKKKS